MLGGGEADERGDELGLGVAAVLVRLLRRAGLAAQLVAVDRRAGRRAARAEHALEHLAHLRGGLLGDHALALRDRPLAAADRVDDVRRAQDAAVGDRGVGGAHLHRRDREALAHRHVGGGRAGVLVVGEHDARLLARQVDAGRRAEAEAAHPLVEAARAERAADQRRADVGRHLRGCRARRASPSRARASR